MIERGGKKLKKANMELTRQGTHNQCEGDNNHQHGTHLTHGLAGASIHLSLSCGPTTAARASRSATTLCCPLHVRSLHLRTQTPIANCNVALKYYKKINLIIDISVRLHL